jgi:putative protease
MTTRQCLFHPIEGCEKMVVDKSCIKNCKRESSIENLDKENFFIGKKEGRYHQVFADTHRLNLDIITDLPDKFDNFNINLSNIKTKTENSLSIKDTVEIFKAIIERDREPSDISNYITPTNNRQYRKGI